MMQLNGLWAAALALLLASQPVAAQSTAVEALEKAGVLERLPASAAVKGTAPGFVLDPAWPQPLPNNWVIGDVGGIAVDAKDHIWVLHRPRSVSSTDSGMLGAAGKDAKGNAISALGHPRPNGPINGCCAPAPSVLEFDQSGKLIQSWGGPADPNFLERRCRPEDGCVWPAREHGIYVDHNGFVYIAGNGQAAQFFGQYPWAPKFGNDSHILKFKADGTFVMQIGTAGAKGPNSNDVKGGVNGTPQPFWPADMVADPKTNILYIADGYGNRRILMIDAGTGKYLGHFGAYGQNPVAGENAGSVVYEPGQTPPDSGSWTEDYKAGRLKPAFFRSPVHCVKLANDGLLYVCDRGNNRVQVFKTTDVGKPCANADGAPGKCGFAAEFLVAPESQGGGTSGTVALSTDRDQSCLFVGDLANDVVYVVNRRNLTELARVGGGGRNAGLFHWPHLMAVDSQGNLYVGEVDGAARAQKFLRFGPLGCSGDGNPKIGAYQTR